MDAKSVRYTGLPVPDEQFPCKTVNNVLQVLYKSQEDATFRKTL